MTQALVEKRPPKRPDSVPSRWTLLRDVLAFQFKLFVDGVRDLVLMPVSLGAAVLDFLGVGPRAGRHFYDLLHLGQKSEHLINLFGATEHADTLMNAPRPGIDSLISRMERLVVNEYERGGITASAKDTVDRALDRLTTRESEAEASARD